MEEKVISSLDGVGLYGVISICIFVGFFAGMLLWAFTRRKQHLDQMGSLPLDGGETDGQDHL